MCNRALRGCRGRPWLPSVRHPAQIGCTRVYIYPGAHPRRPLAHRGRVRRRAPRPKGDPRGGARATGGGARADRAARAEGPPWPQPAAVAGHLPAAGTRTRAEACDRASNSPRRLLQTSLRPTRLQGLCPAPRALAIGTIRARAPWRSGHAKLQPYGVGGAKQVRPRRGGSSSCLCLARARNEWLCYSSPPPRVGLSRD